MFKFPFKSKAAAVRSVVTFDEAYCHSAGTDTTPATYDIQRGTTELVFQFPDFESFWQTYVNRNEGLSDDTLIALRDGAASFVFQVVEDGAHLCIDGVNDAGEMILNAGTLKQMGAKAPLKTFNQGVLAIGIYHPGAMRFEVLWATMYRAS
jgi:hypothetical protein